jgi:hypothetical protein
MYARGAPKHEAGEVDHHLAPEVPEGAHEECREEAVAEAQEDGGIAPNSFLREEDEPVEQVVGEAVARPDHEEQRRAHTPQEE